MDPFESALVKRFGSLRRSTGGREYERSASSSAARWLTHWPRAPAGPPSSGARSVRVARVGVAEPRDCERRAWITVKGRKATFYAKLSNGSIVVNEEQNALTKSNEVIH
jgi:hypothetical protein